MKPFLLLNTFVLIVAMSQFIAAADHFQTNEIRVLTLDQALALADRFHPELTEAKALIDAAEGRVKQAAVFPNPAAIARMESARIHGRPGDQAEYLAGISQPIPLSGRLSKARQAEELERDRRRLELEVRRRDLQKRVHGAFATALYQQKAFQTQRGVVADAKKVVATTKARVDVGDAVREELARAEMELFRARIELRRVEALVEHSMIELKAAMGDTSLPVETLAGSLEATFDIPTLDAVIADLAAHPEMALNEAAVRAGQARVDLANVERVPDVRVEALYRRLESSKENAFDVGFSIQLPLFDRNQGRLREARAEVVAAKARSQSAQNALSVRVHEAHAQLSAALANSRALKSEVLPRADLVLKTVEARFSAGDIALTELLPVRRDWAAAQLDYLESLRDVMQAWAELRTFVR